MTRALAAWVAQRVKVRLAYRGDFVFQALGDAVITLVGLFLIATIFTHVPDVRGWDVHELLVCWGMAEACLGTFWVVFQGIYAINRTYILGGELDRLLLRPVDPFVQILLDNLHLEDVPVIGLGLVVLAVGAQGVAVTWGPAEVLMLPVMVVSGALVIGGLLTAVTALGFWVHHQGSAIGLAYQLTVYGRYPLDFLPRPLAILVSTAMPFTFAGFLPATWFLDRPEWHPYAAIQPLVGVVVMFAAHRFWTWSSRRYASTGT